jgi:stalled ribosome rescue protein Dom34
MQGHFHAVVWIDHRQARVFHFNADDADKIVVHPDHPVHEHHRTKKGTGQHEKEDQAFLEEVTKTIAEAGAILIVGPANEKNELMKHIERVHPKMKVNVEGVESADHPTDGELVAHARRFLRSADRMRTSA